MGCMSFTRRRLIMMDYVIDYSLFEKVTLWLSLNRVANRYKFTIN